MIFHTLNPTIVSIGFIQIRWYSLFYILGLVLAYFFIKHMTKMSKEDMSDYIVYLAMGLLIGGRVIYFLFYDTKTLFTDPLELFKLWNGGMSFHGGLIGAAVGAWIFCKKKNQDFWKMADLTVMPLALALAFGRIGNFINGELFGRVWDGALCIDYSKNTYINGPAECRFPSQFLESAKNLVIFATLWTIKGMKLPKGFMFWTFITMYGLLRFLVEFGRQPDPQLGFILGPFTMGQLLSSVMFIAGSIMLIRLAKRFK